MASIQMAAFLQPPFFSSLLPINNNNNKTPALSLPQSNCFPTFKTWKISSSNSSESPPNSDQNSNDEDDPIKLAFARARTYKNRTQSNPATTSIERSDPKIVQKSDAMNSAQGVEKNTDELKPDEADDDDGEKEVPSAVKLAMEKAKEYKKNKEDSIAIGNQTLASENEKSSAAEQSMKNGDKKGNLSVSSMDFVGLGFADKKSGRGLPAGLVQQSDPFVEGKLPEVEILVGDASKFGDATAAASKAVPIQEDDVDLYKPKVSTWGVFPRPTNISKTYGGGRNIRPGEALESAEEKAVKEERTRKLVAAYKSKTGLNVDPKLRSECEKALKDGDSLMDVGKLKEALPFYEKVMEMLAFQNELHGLAALQWSICLDSLSRPDEARVMYEKLQSHPSPGVSKKARQFNFGFQAMEMMKVSGSTGAPLNTGYQNYFEAFVEEKANYSMSEDREDEGRLNQALPYVIFLASPIVMVLLIAASKFQ